MKKNLIVANWKMNLSLKDSKNRAREFATSITQLSERFKKNLPHIVICPSFSALSAVHTSVRATRGLVKVGSQDCFWDPQGAFTGEESPVFLRELGVEYIIVGHSERRMYLGETHDMIEKKIHSFVKEHTLIPILCVGEKKEDRASAKRTQVISRQILSAISSIRKHKPARPLVIAYEPVWAIGTGNPCTARDCARVNSLIKKILSSYLGTAYTAEWCRIIYGGSVSAKNIRDFVVEGISEGALVGGASLQAREFFHLIRSLL
ncbi:triose-phosphate isomerase [Candidatus Uhrbacteria bacterium]|nr:triose-phosphate isomerase [Candidatus Uhrbacteria bacterium]